MGRRCDRTQQAPQPPRLIVVSNLDAGRDGTPAEALAIDGGSPVRESPLPPETPPQPATDAEPAAALEREIAAMVDDPPEAVIACRDRAEAVRLALGAALDVWCNRFDGDRVMGVDGGALYLQPPVGRDYNGQNSHGVSRAFLKTLPMAERRRRQGSGRDSGYTG